MPDPATRRQPAPAESFQPLVVKDLRRRDRLIQFKSIALVVGAVPLMLIGPLVLGTIFWFATWQLYAYYSWSWFFWGLCLVMIPAMLATEARQRGGYFAGANLDNASEGLTSGTAIPMPFGPLTDVPAL